MTAFIPSIMIGLGAITINVPVVFMARYVMVLSSVADPDPPDPHVFGPPGSGSTSQSYGSGSYSGSGSGSFYHHAKIVRKTLIPIVL